MFCISMYSEVSMPNNTCTIRPTVHVGIDHFIYHGYIYWICVSFVFPCTVKVSIRNYTRTIRPSVHRKNSSFFIMVIYTGFPYVCFVFPCTVKVSIRNYTCNIYKTKCTS